MNYEIPQNEYDPHPEGEHTGTIVKVIDQGMQETKYGQKYKLTAVIESQTAIQDSGEPFQLWVWFTLSSGPKSNLVQLRQKLLRRTLTKDERLHFDPDEEMVGRKVRYFVEHNFSEEGRTFANLVTWAPLEQGQAARQAREQLQPGQNNGQPPDQEEPNEAPEEEQPEDEAELVQVEKDGPLPF